MTWSPLFEVAQTRDGAPSEQPSLGNGWPSPVAKHSALNDFGLINLRQHWMGLETGVFGRPSQVSLRLPSVQPTRSIVGRPGLELAWTALRPMATREFAEHIHCTMTVGKPHLIRLQLVGTESTWQGRAAAVAAALQVSRDVTTSLEKLTQTACYANH